MREHTVYHSDLLVLVLLLAVVEGFLGSYGTKGRRKNINIRGPSGDK